MADFTKYLARPSLSSLSSTPPPHSRCLLRLMDHSIIDEAAVRGEGTRLLQCDEFSTLSNYISNQARLAPWPQTGSQPTRKSQRKYWLRFDAFIYLLIHFALHCGSTAPVFFFSCCCHVLIDKLIKKDAKVAIVKHFKCISHMYLRQRGQCTFITSTSSPCTPTV